tara:strand:- start:1444 stop:2088 length:645 start_codon:yes stop_codon:yes gene_type:complete
MVNYFSSATSFILNGTVVATIAVFAHSSSVAQSETQNYLKEATIITSETEDNYRQYPDLIDNQEANCLALNVYYEARSDNLAGMYAVSDVVLNRVRDDRYPNTICEVVYQGPTRESWKTKQDPDLPDEERKYNPVRNMCQFSWYCDGKDDIPDDETGWATAQYVAGSILYANKHRGLTEGATHYHATYVKPRWTRDRGMNHVGRIGSHIFYRWD